MKIRISASVTLFRIGILLIGISKLWRFSNGQDKALLVMGLAILIWKIVVVDRNYSKYQTMSLMIVALFCIVVFIKTVEQNLFTLFIIVFSMKGIETNGALKEFLILNIVFFIGTIVLCKIGILYDDVYYFSRPGQILARHSYGFGHPNQLYLRFFIISTIILCFSEKKHKIKTALIFIISLVLYNLSNSRAGFYCVVLLLAITTILDFTGNKANQLVSTIMVGVYFVVVSIPVIFLFLDNQLVWKIDQIMTGRISLANKVINSYSLSPFGLNKQIADRYVVDNSYMYILIHYGIFFYILYVAVMGYVVYILYRRKMKYEMLAMLMVHIYAMVECILINPIFNFCILFVGAIIMDSRKLKKDVG